MFLFWAPKGEDDPVAGGIGLSNDEERYSHDNMFAGATADASE